MLCAPLLLCRHFRGRADRDPVRRTGAFHERWIVVGVPPLPTAGRGRGTTLDIAVIPEPVRIRSRSKDFVASYVNYYVCNGGVIGAEFGDDAADAKAQEILRALYPGRQVVSPNIDPIGAAGGGIHSGPTARCVVTVERSLCGAMPCQAGRTCPPVELHGFEARAFLHALNDRAAARIRLHRKLPDKPGAGDPGRIRTCGHPLRRRVLYPAELRGRTPGECRAEPTASRAPGKRGQGGLTMTVMLLCGLGSRV